MENNILFYLNARLTVLVYLIWAYSTLNDLILARLLDRFIDVRILKILKPCGKFEDHFMGRRCAHYRIIVQWSYVDDRYVEHRDDQ